MLRNQMTEQGERELNDWVDSEWHRCATMTSNFEGHAVTYLTTANGGGAAAVIAFSGSAGYAENGVYIALSLFMFGVLLAGFVIAVGYRNLTKITRGLGTDQRSFNKNEITTSQLGQNHHQRFDRFSLGEPLAWLSFVAFIVALIWSGFTFSEYQNFKKAEKVKQEVARQEQVKEPVLNVSCVQPAVQKCSRK